MNSYRFKSYLIIAFILLIGAGSYAQSFQYISTSPTDNTARIKKASSVALNSAGHLYISDVSEGAIYVFDSTGVQLEVITSIAGNNQSYNLKSPEHIFIDHQNQLYVYDASLGKILVRRNDGTGLVFGEKGSNLGMIAKVAGIAVDYEGYIYLLNADRAQIDIFSPEGYFLTWIHGDTNSFTDPVAIGINSRNELFVLEKDGPSLFIYDVHGTLINTHRNMSRKQGVSLSKPLAMAVLPNGDFFILDQSSASVTHIDQLGTVQGTIGTKGKSSKGVFGSAIALTVGRNDRCNFAVLDQSVNQAQLFNLKSVSAPLPRGSKRMQIVSQADSKVPAWDIAVAKNGDRYVIPFNNRQQVVVYNGNNDNEFRALASKFDEAVAIASDNNGQIYVVDRKAREIVMFDSTGTFMRKFGKDIPESLKEPTSIAIQKNGDVLVGDHGTGNIHLWNSAIVYQRIVLRGEKSGIKSVNKIQLDSKDQIYIWDERENAIFRAASSGSPVTLKQLRARGEKVGKTGVISGFFVDPLDQIHLYNSTTRQLEIYIWGLEIAMKFSSGKPGPDQTGFTGVDHILLDPPTFKIYMPCNKGARQECFQLLLKPPVPEDIYKFDIDNDKLTVTVNAIESKAVVGYALFNKQSGNRQVFVYKSDSPTLIVNDSTNQDIALRHYCVATMSYTGYSDLNNGFDDHFGYANRLLDAERYDDALIAYENALRTMGKAPKFIEAIANNLAIGGKALARTKEVVRSMQFLKLAYSLAPGDKNIRDAYSTGFKAMFQQMAEKDEMEAIVDEVERAIVNPNMKAIVLKSVEDLSLELSDRPSDGSINQAISLQKKLVEWELLNARYPAMLASSHYKLFLHRKNNGSPSFEQEAALKEGDKYGKQAVAMLKKEKAPYHKEMLLHLELLNAYGKYAEAEKLTINELAQTSFALDNDLTCKYRSQLAQSYRGQQKYDLAVLEYQRIQTVYPEDQSVIIPLSECLAAGGKYDDAKQLIQQLLLKDRDNTQLTARVGKIELQKKNYVEASFMLEKASKMDPSDKSVYGPLAEAFDGATNYQRALDCYNIAIQFQEAKLAQSRARFASESELTDVKTQLTKYLMSVARLNDLTGNFDESIKAYNKIIAEQPTYAEAYYGLGKSNLSSGLLYDAEKALYTACKLDPSREDYTNAHASAVKERDQLAKTQPPLNILEIQVKDIFPSLYRNYSDVKLLSLGEMVVANNTSQPITPSSITVFVKEIMRQPTQIKSPALVGFSNNYVKLSALFDERILSYTQQEKLQMDIEIKYIHAGQEKSAKKNVTFTLNGRNAISWYDKRCLGAFITPASDVLVNYDRKIDQIFRTQRNFGLNRSILKAMQIYTFLSKDGFGYSPDPARSFATVSTNTEMLDFLQYPAETIKRKGGDCDDLVALLAGLLENAGVACAYIDVPGHVFMAFDTQLRPDQLVENGLSSMDVIVVQDKVWIPIETTFIGKQDFLAAWQVASRRYYDELTKGNFPELVSFADAHNVYVPSDYVPADWNEEPVATDATISEYHKLIAQLLTNTKRQVIVDMENRYLSEPDNVYIKNKYANTLAQIGEYSKARKVMQEALNLSPNSAVVLNNLGNIYMLESDFSNAIIYYEQAAKIDDSDSEIYVNLCRAHLKKGDRDQALSYFKKAKQINPEIDLYYKQLKSQLQ